MPIIMKEINSNNHKHEFAHAIQSFYRWADTRNANQYRVYISQRENPTRAGKNETNPKNLLVNPKGVRAPSRLASNTKKDVDMNRGVAHYIDFENIFSIHWEEGRTRC